MSHDSFDAPTPLGRFQHLDILRRVPFLAHLQPGELMGLYRQMALKRWYGGAIIVGEDEPGTALHVVVQGRARRVLFGENGREMTLATFGPGDCFGELALVDGQPRASNVVAEEDVVLLVLRRERLMDHLAAHPQTAFRLMEALAARLRRATEIINNLALHDVSSRLMRTLLALAEEAGEPFDDGLLIRKRPTQQELANMVGTCRETVSRALTAMSRQGLIATRGRTVFLTRELVEGIQVAA